jgi:aminoglycoside/choline kinase family phosphotransferase
MPQQGSSTAVDLQRRDARQAFARDALGAASVCIARASEDASFRSYWRVSPGPDGHASCILMDAPPGKEDLGPWLDIAARLRNAGLHAPQVFALDQGQGFVLMEDLGTRTLLPELADASVEALYAQAMEALLRMQCSASVDGLPAYDRQRLLDEMNLLPIWFLQRHLGFQPNAVEQAIIDEAFAFLTAAAEEQPRAFVHRDFHSRNLLRIESAEPITADGLLVNPAIVDFQDAVCGPVTYDLVSLLRDCYIAWDVARVQAWVETYRLRLLAAQRIDPTVDRMRFLRWFDLMGLQRHIKVLGIFCRLWYRDGKRQYLNDLPLVWHYTISVASAYPQLADFCELLRRVVGERDIRQNRELEAG